MLHSKAYNSTHTYLNPFAKISSSKTIPLVPVKPILWAEETGQAQVNVPPVQAEFTTTTGTRTTCGEQLTVNQL